VSLPSFRSTGTSGVYPALVVGVLATVAVALAGCADPTTLPELQPAPSKTRPVTSTPTRVELTPGTHVLRVGWTQQASATVFDQNGTAMADVSLKWRSSDTLAATVSKTGLVTRKSAVGIATIQAVTSGNKPIVGSAVVAGVREHSTMAAGGFGYFPGHTCALGSTTGVPSCWGTNDFSELGLGLSAYFNRRTTPERSVGEIALVSVTSGANHHCGLSAAGQAYCWGENAGGQSGLGNTDVGVTFAPTAVTGGHIFASLATSSRAPHTCALKSDGQAFCWGSNGGQLLGQDESLIYSSTPLAVPQGSLRFVQTAVGGTHTCALTNAGAAHCWGSMWDGQLGNGIVQPYRTTGTPTAVLQGDHRIAKLVLGRGFSCGLTTTGRLLCWGYGSHVSVTGIPTVLNDTRRYIDIAAGDWSTCLLDANQEAYCLGANDRGQLGSDVESYKPLPTKVNTTTKFTELTVGGVHACGRALNGTVLCWGENDRGALGDGTTASRSTPAPTLPITP